MREKACGIRDLGRKAEGGDGTDLRAYRPPDVERPGRGASRPGLGSTWGSNWLRLGITERIGRFVCSKGVFPGDFADCFNCFVARNLLAGPGNTLAGSGRPETLPNDCFGYIFRPRGYRRP